MTGNKKHFEQGVINPRHKITSKTSPIHIHFIHSPLFSVIEQKQKNLVREVTATFNKTEYEVIGPNLNWDTDFPLFALVIKRWEFRNRNAIDDEISNEFFIPFSELRNELVTAKSGDSEAFLKIENSIDRLKSNSFSIRRESQLGIEGLLNRSTKVCYEDERLYVSLPTTINQLYALTDVISYIDLSIVKRLQSQYSIGLYTYLKTQSKVFLAKQKAGRLKQVLGVNNPYIKENEKERTKQNQREKNINRAIQKAIGELVKVGFLIKDGSGKVPYKPEYHFQLDRPFSKQESSNIEKEYLTGKVKQSSENSEGCLTNTCCHDKGINSNSEQTPLKPDYYFNLSLQDPNFSDTKMDKYGFLLHDQRYGDDINFNRRCGNWMRAYSIWQKHNKNENLLDGHVRNVLNNPLIAPDFRNKYFTPHEAKKALETSEKVKDYNLCIVIDRNEDAKEILDSLWL